MRAASTSREDPAAAAAALGAATSDRSPPGRRRIRDRNAFGIGARAGRGAGLEAVPEDASRTEYAVSAAPASDAAAIASDGHVDVDTVYAAASELQRGRVTALDAVEGLAVDANEALNDRAVSVMRRMSHKLTGRDGTPGSAAAAAGAAGDGGGGAGSPGAQARNDELDNAAPDGVEAQVQRLVVAATSHENLCQSYVGWCPFW